MQNKKIALIGGGNIGGTLAQLILMQKMAHVALVDVADGIAQGKALDLAQAGAITGIECNIVGGQDYALIKDSNVVIVTAGVARKPGMSRDDLLSINANIVKSVAENIKNYCPQAFVIVVTNPLDIMVWVMQKASQLPYSKVVGMAGVLDSGRYKLFLSEALNISVQDIEAFVLGGHGNTMVPMPRYTTIAGISLFDLIKKGYLSKQKLDEIIERTRSGGAEIVNLLKTGSAFYAPAAAALQMAEAYLYDQKRILPCAAYLNGEYEVKGEYVGVPVVIGKNGVEKIIELNLEPQEKSQFQASVQAVIKLKEDLLKLGVV